MTDTTRLDTSKVEGAPTVTADYRGASTASRGTSTLYKNTLRTRENVPFKRTEGTRDEDLTPADPNSGIFSRVASRKLKGLAAPGHDLSIAREDTAGNSSVTDETPTTPDTTNSD